MLCAACTALHSILPGSRRRAAEEDTQSRLYGPRPAEETFETRRKGQEREPQKGKSGGVEGGLVRASSIRRGGGTESDKEMTVSVFFLKSTPSVLRLRTFFFSLSLSLSPPPPRPPLFVLSPCKIMKESELASAPPLMLEYTTGQIQNAVRDQRERLSFQRNYSGERREPGCRAHLLRL